MRSLVKYCRNVFDGGYSLRKLVYALVFPNGVTSIFVSASVCDLNANGCHVINEQEIDGVRY